MAESSGTDLLAWYVVATKPRQEALAQEHLMRQGYSTLLPTLRMRKRQRGKWREVTEPTFPGYVFVGLELGRDDFAPIRSTQGCRSLVRFGQQPAIVPEQIMRALRLSDNNQLAPGDELKDPFSPGDVVTVEEGPFIGLSAIYCMAKGADRVHVLISILGGDHRLNIDLNSIS